MHVTETLSDGLHRSYAVRVPADEIESRARARLADIGKTLRLPGFRPGKVPPNLIRKRYGSSVMAEVLQEAVNGVADKVVAERQLRPAGQPRVSLEGKPQLDSATAQDLDLKVELELLPDIALPDLTALTLTRYKAEASEATVARALDSIATQNRTFEDLEPRPAEPGDVLVVDFTGRIDGAAFQGGSATDASVEVGGAGFIPGFSEQLAGLAPGETRTIDVTFPDGYQVAELAGKAAQFDISAKALKRAITPAQDDALAAKVGLESFAALREAVVAQIQREYDQLARLRIKRELLDALSELARFPSPQNLLDAEFAAIWQRVDADRREGRIDDEDAGKDEDTLKAEYRAIADRRVRLGLLLAEIGRVNNVEVTQAELTAALRAEMSRYPGQEQQVLDFFQKNAGAVQQLRGPIFEDKVVDHILAMAQVTDKLVAPEELALPATEAGDQPALAGFAEPDADRGVETDAALDTEPVAEMHAEAADSADAVAP
jgi:trigger factor